MDVHYDDVVITSEDLKALGLWVRFSSGDSRFDVIEAYTILNNESKASVSASEGSLFSVSNANPGGVSKFDLSFRPVFCNAVISIILHSTKCMILSILCRNPLQLNCKSLKLLFACLDYIIYFVAAVLNILRAHFSL